MNELDDGRQTGANQGPDERTDDRQIDSKAASEPGGDATGHQTGCTYSRSAPSIESCCVSFGIMRTLRSSAGSQEGDQQCWPEQISDVLDGISWR
jgi:hypothetical protein